MKKLQTNEFELLNDAQTVLQMVWDKFDGMGQCADNSDEIWAITGCNGFETVRIDYDDETELYTINISHCYYDRGNEILEYIEEAKAQIV
jgi:hypothetical protein